MGAGVTETSAAAAAAAAASFLAGWADKREKESENYTHSRNGYTETFIHDLAIQAAANVRGKSMHTKRECSEQNTQIRRCNDTEFESIQQRRFAECHCPLTLAAKKASSSSGLVSQKNIFQRVRLKGFIFFFLTPSDDI